MSNEVCPDVLESWLLSLPPDVLGKEKSNFMSSLSLVMRQEEATDAIVIISNEIATYVHCILCI